jgi:hypothetical protein
MLTMLFLHTRTAPHTRRALKALLQLALKAFIVLALAAILTFIPFAASLTQARAQTMPTSASGAESLIQYGVRSIIFTPPNRIDFDIIITNTSTEAIRWANGTAQLGLSGVSLRASTLTLDSTALTLLTSTVQTIPRTGYSLQSRVNPMLQTIQLAVLGPDEASRCLLVPAGDSVLLGRFRLALGDNLQNVDSIRFSWLVSPLSLGSPSSPNTPSTPSLFSLVQNPLQATAAKASQLSVVRSAEFYPQDNIAQTLSADVVQGEQFRAPEAVLQSLTASFVGDVKTRVAWRADVVFSGVRSLNAGFVLRRGVIPLDETSPARARFSGTARDTVATFRTNTQYRITTANARSEMVFVDSTIERNRNYAYELSFVDASPAASGAVSMPRATLLGVTSATVPNAIISSAAMLPNPVSARGTLRYTLEDRVRLTVHMFDMEGRTVGTLLNDSEQPRGSYDLPVSVVGLPKAAYYLVLTAEALRDASALRSRARVPLIVAP